MEKQDTKPLLSATDHLGIPSDINASHPYSHSPRKRILQNFVLVWIDSTIVASNQDTQHALEKLRSVVYDVYVFNEVDEGVEFLTEIDNQQVFLIVSGTQGELLVPHIHSVPQLTAIYIYDNNQEQHEQWVKGWCKIKGIYKDIEPLCEALRLGGKQCNQDLTPISVVDLDENVSNIDLNRLDPSFMYTRLFKNILLDIKYDTKSRQDLVRYYQNEFADNAAQLRAIDEFDQTYHPDKAIWWYTRQSFIYQTLNQALRLLEGDIIVDMGFFIRDLHLQLEEVHKQQVSNYGGKGFTVFRGQGLSIEHFEKFRQTKHGILAFNSFLSTSNDRLTSLAFAMSAAQNQHMVGVLFVMNIDPKLTSTPFAHINSFSYFSEEVEILFSMHTVFRVGLITPMDEHDRIFEVQLNLTEDDDLQLRALTTRIQEEIGGGTAWERISILLIRAGQLNKAEHLYQVLLAKTTDLNDEILYHNHLGHIKNQQGDHKAAVRHYQKVLDIGEQILSANHPYLAASYNNIGLVCKSMGEYSKALLYSQKALDICQETLSADHPSLTTSYNNMGSIYDDMGEYAKALFYYEKDLDICQKTLPYNHPYLATSYNNIGLAYNNLGEYPKALLYYQKALDIYEKTLPSNHSSLAASYNNIGLAYNNIGDYSKALFYYEKALAIREKTLSANHPDLAASFNNIGLVYDNMGEYSKALLYYQKDLNICQETLSSNHSSLATSYNNVGSVYDIMGEYSKALFYYEKALAIREKALSDNHPSLAISYNNMGAVYTGMGEYPQALFYFNKALAIRDKTLPANHPSLATSCNNIGLVYKNMGEYSKALFYLEKALAIREKILPTNHPSLAISYKNIGLVYDDIGEYSKALSFFERWLYISERTGFPTDPDLQEMHELIQRIKRKL